MSESVTEKYESIPAKVADAAVYIASGARNSLAIINELHEIVSELKKEMHQNCHGTKWLNQHPAVVVIVDQLFHLAHLHSGDEDWLDHDIRCRQILDCFKTWIALKPRCKTQTRSLATTMEVTEEKSCTMCGGPLNEIGILGTLRYLKCRNCGWITSEKIPNPPNPQKMLLIKSHAKERFEGSERLFNYCWKKYRQMIHDGAWVEPISVDDMDEDLANIAAELVNNPRSSFYMYGK